MFAILTIHTLILLLAIVSTPPSLVGAVVTLLRPDPGEKVKAGASCLVQWKGDTDSKTIWKKMSIQLMTGDNYNMVFLKSMSPLNSTYRTLADVRLQPLLLTKTELLTANSNILARM